MSALSERRQHQKRFAETYVALASELQVSERDLIAGLRSHVGSEAVQKSGYPGESWMAGQRAVALLRNDYVVSEIKRLAEVQLAQSDLPLYQQWTMTHLVRCGRLNLPDYARMAEQIPGTPIEELKDLHAQNKLADFYFWKLRELAFVSELSLTVEKFEQLAAEAGRTPQQFYEDKQIEMSQAREQEMWDDVRKGSKLLTFVKNHDLWPAFEAIMNDEGKTAALVEFISGGKTS